MASKDEDILAVRTRKDLYEFVRRNPGFHLRELSRSLNLSITLADYHLGFLRQPVPLRVMNFLMEREDATHKLILEQVPVSPSTLSHHLKKMQAAGIIDRAEVKERGYRIRNPKSVARLMATYELASSDQVDTFIRVWGEFRL